MKGGKNWGGRKKDIRRGLLKLYGMGWGKRDTSGASFP